MDGLCGDSVVSGEARALPEGHMLVRDDTKKKDGRRRSTDVAWWVNQRITVSLKARLDRMISVEELENT